MKYLLVLLVLIPFSNLCHSQRAKKVFVHYLPWFDSSGTQFAARSGWCYPSLDIDCTDLNIIHYANKPLIGEYSLFDEHVLEYHLLLIFATGIDGLIININPASEMQKAASLVVLDRINSLQAEQDKFSLEIMVSYDDGGGQSTTEILEYMTWVYDNIYNNPTYSSLVFRDDVLDVPVLVIWSESNNEYYWNTARSLFNDNVFVVVRNPVNFDFSDGNFEWVNYLNTGLPKSNTENWGEQLFENMLWRMARQSTIDPIVSTVNTVKMGMVYPGFDDGNVPSFWNGGTNRYILRSVDDGSTLTNTWTKNIDFSPFRLGGTDEIENPWIQIITWNDWPEGTSIEPATADTYGYKAIKECQKKIGVFKGLGEDWIPESALNNPYIIYTYRLSGFTLNADLLVDALLNSVCENRPCASPSVSLTPSSSPSTSISVSPSSSSSTSLTPSVTPSTTSSPLMSVSTSVTPSVSTSITSSLSPSPSPSTSSSGTPSVTTSISTSMTPSLIPSPSPSTSSSETPSVTTSISTSMTPRISPGASSSTSPSVTASPGSSSSVSATPSVTTTTASPFVTPSHTADPMITPSISPWISASQLVAPSKSPRESISLSVSPSPTQSTFPSASSSSSISAIPSSSASQTPALSPRANFLRCFCECEGLSENGLAAFKSRCELLLKAVDSSYANIFKNSFYSFMKEDFEELNRNGCDSIGRLCSDFQAEFFR